MRPGVVSLPHGFGHGRPGTRLATANEHPGASVNDVTDDLLLDPLSGTSALNGVPVAVEGAYASAAAHPVPHLRQQTE